MTKRESYEQKTLDLVTKITEPLGISVYDVEYVKEGSSWYLRVYIEKEGGVTVNDCEAVHRPLSESLDREDFISDAYILEVSSLGLGRPLKKDKDFQRNIGQDVEIHLYKKVGEFKDYIGTLLSFDKDTVTVNTDDTEMTFDRKNLAKINEYIDWDV